MRSSKSQQETDGLLNRRGQGGFIYRGSIYKGVGIGEAEGRGQRNDLFHPGQLQGQRAELLRMENGSAETMGNLVI